MISKTRYSVLKLIDIPKYLKNSGAIYVDGYIYALYSHDIISLNQLKELRALYWEKPIKDKEKPKYKKGIKKYTSN